MREYLGILIVFVIAAAIAGGFILLTSLLGPKKPSLVKQQPFECGVEPIMRPGGRFPVKFYLLAMLFILFDIELVFLFPWAVVFRSLGWGGYLEMLLFLAVVVLGFLYAWKKGALEWER